MQTILNLFSLLFAVFMTWGCNTSQKEYFEVTDEIYDTIDGESVLVEQIVKTLRVSDSLPVAILNRIANIHEDDGRLRYLTGIEKEAGVQDFTLDSIFYDAFNNDTLKIGYFNYDGNWQPRMKFTTKIQF